jgi:cell division septation protein DedD
LFRALSVEQTIGLATGLLLAGAAAALLAGLAQLRGARNRPFYLLRREATQAGWRMIFLAGGFVVLAFVVRLFGAPTVFRYVPPTPTRTGTPSITPTPSITLTPSRTVSPTITRTPEPTNTLPPTPTPRLPSSLLSSFTGIVTPLPEAVISPVTAARSFTRDYRPLTNTDVFFNPIRRMYGFFSYDSMSDGVQWTAIWYRDGVVVYYETEPWDGGAGGYGFTEWDLSPDFFIPGAYEIQIFVGTEFKAGGRFTIVGAPPTSTITRTPTRTATPSFTPSLTATRPATRTPTPTNTRAPTATEATPTPRPTATLRPSLTPSPSSTRWPSPTPDRR